MKFKEIMNRVTGISCPIFGMSWNPVHSDIQSARNVLVFLEARRVLYAPSEMEVPQHCIMSVIEIKHFLTEQLMSIKHDTKLYEYVSAMRLSCNKFLNKCDEKKKDVVDFSGHWGHWSSWYFASALGEMRGVFGIMIMQIASSYGLDIEEDLALIIPDNLETNEKY